MDLSIFKISPDSNADARAPSQKRSFLTIAVINLHLVRRSTESKSTIMGMAYTISKNWVFLYEFWNSYCNAALARLLIGKDLQGDSNGILKGYCPGGYIGISQGMNGLKTGIFAGFKLKKLSLLCPDLAGCLKQPSALLLTGQLQVQVQP
jgi:hypothetical protein